MRLAITVIAIFISVIMVSSASSQTEGLAEDTDVKKQYLYEWTDNKGIAHITDGLGKVPEQYRSKARKIESPKATETRGQEQQMRQERGYARDSGAANTEAYAKAEWQQRIRGWKERLAKAEKQYQDLEHERNELFRAWGSAALAPVENRVRAQEIEKQMKEVQQEVDRSENMIEVVIPEEARKAGVPPGWLRE